MWRHPLWVKKRIFKIRILGMAEVSTCPMFVFNHLTRECIPTNSVLGNTLCIASGKPFRPSTQHISYPEHLCFEDRLEPLTRSLHLHSWRHTYQEVPCGLPCWCLRRCKWHVRPHVWFRPSPYNGYLLQGLFRAFWRSEAQRNRHGHEMFIQWPHHSMSALA